MNTNYKFFRLVNAALGVIVGFAMFGALNTPLFALALAGLAIATASATLILIASRL